MLSFKEYLLDQEGPSMPIRLLKAGRNNNNYIRFLFIAKAEINLNKFALFIQRNGHIISQSFYRFEDYLTQKNEYICLFLQENHGVRINGRRIQTFAMNNNFQMQDGDCVSLVKLTNEQQIYYEA